MYGVYVKCDRCGVTLGGEQVTTNPEPPLDRWGGLELRRRAALRGWTTIPIPWDLTNGGIGDLCPTCSKEKQ